MTERERQVFNIIKTNPVIEQSELARRLGISRSSAAAHIGSLQRKGYLLGKGYIVKEESYIVGVGAANVDIHGKSRESIIMHDSNPGHMHSSTGGVTRNVCENLSRLGANVKLISAVGDDVYADMIRRDCTAAGIDISRLYSVHSHPSSTYISILDENGDMLVALSDMSILERLPKEHIKAAEGVLNGACAVTCDPSLPADMLEYLLNMVRVPVFIDPVSTAYARRMYDFTGRFDTIKPNRMEAEILSGIAINDDKSLHTAAERILAKGTKRVVISLGAEGCFYSDSAGNELRRCLKPVSHMVNATGAGDAFMAGLIFCLTADKPIEFALDFALGAGMVALMGANTINELISEENVLKTIKENSKL